MTYIDEINKSMPLYREYNIYYKDQAKKFSNNIKINMDEYLKKSSQIMTKHLTLLDSAKQNSDYMVVRLLDNITKTLIDIEIDFDRMIDIQNGLTEKSREV